MSRYLDIRALQEPFSIGVDQNNREMFSCNYEATIAGLATQLEEEVYRWLFDGSIASLNVDTVIGPRTPPTTGSPVWSNILTTGGGPPDETHNGDQYSNVSFQIITRSASYITARNRALAIRSRLHAVRNQVITAA